MVYFDLIGGIISTEGFDITQNTPTLMSNVRCNGRETFLQSCSHDSWESTINKGYMLMVSCHSSKYMESF